MIRVGLLVLTLLVSLFGSLESHAMWGWMRGAAAIEFNDADWEIVKNTARRTLDTGPDGKQVNWTNGASGNK